MTPAPIFLTFGFFALTVLFPGRMDGQELPISANDPEIEAAGTADGPPQAVSTKNEALADGTGKDEATTYGEGFDRNKGTVREKASNAQNGWYARPDPKTRFRRYIASFAGPVALVRYTAVAGVLTYRNAPKEWGGRSDGFARRFASNMGESVIKNSIKYGLDEALEIDSRFYLSRNRSITARARNSVFSAVTARDRNGKRVFGLPKLAGHVVSNVVSAEVWYPPRYDYVHGLKGAAISAAVDVGINLFREFVVKR